MSGASILFVCLYVCFVCVCVFTCLFVFFVFCFSFCHFVFSCFCSAIFFVYFLLFCYVLFFFSFYFFILNINWCPVYSGIIKILWNSNASVSLTSACSPYQHSPVLDGEGGQKFTKIFCYSRPNVNLVVERVLVNFINNCKCKYNQLNHM